MLPNATINAWRTRTGTTGAGEPVFTDSTIDHKIPCERLTPGSRRKASERAVGVALSRVVNVTRKALGSIEPAPGDRVTIATTRTPAVQEELDLVEARTLADEAGEVLELVFGRRIDSEAS